MSRFVRIVVAEIARVGLPLAVLAVGVAAFAAISSRRQPPPQVVRAESQLVVETSQVGMHHERLDFNVDGLVVPHREIKLSAEVGGRITQKSPECRAGRFVKQGTILVQIDPRTYELDVQRLTEQAKQAAAGVAENEVEIENAGRLVEIADYDAVIHKREFDRTLSLSRQRAISESEVDTAKKALLAAQSSLTTVQNQLRTLEARRPRLQSEQQLAQVQLERAQLDFERATVRAPVDGVVVTESVEEESFVQPGSPLVTVEDTTAAEVRCNLKMEELAWLWQQNSLQRDDLENGSPGRDYQLPQTPVTVTYRLGDDEFAWAGVLSRYEGIGLDERTRTVPCRVLVSEPRRPPASPGSASISPTGPRALVRGMYVRVTVHARPDDSLLKIPQGAIQPGNVVWSVENGKLRRNVLSRPHLLDDVALVSPGATSLKAGDNVVVTPLSVAVEGMPVAEKQRAASALAMERGHE